MKCNVALSAIQTEFLRVRHLNVLLMEGVVVLVSAVSVSARGEPFIVHV